jgi:hypothetical protein
MINSNAQARSAFAMNQFWWYFIVGVLNIACGL